MYDFKIDFIYKCGTHDQRIFIVLGANTKTKKPIIVVNNVNSVPTTKTA